MVPGQDAEMSDLVRDPSTNKRYLCLGGKAFLEYICDGLEAVSGLLHSSEKFGKRGLIIMKI